MQNGFDDFTANLTAEEMFSDEERLEILNDFLRLEEEAMAEERELAHIAALDLGDDYNA